jgi:uncharacterized protein YbjT (DUF2867 family)
MILVTGANGTTGSEITRQLARQEVPVRAMVRRPETAGGLPKQGVEVVLGDFADVGSLDVAMTGVEAVFLASFEHPDQLALQGNVIAAAKRADVRIVARLSASGADPDLDDPIESGHGKGDRQLADSGLSYVLLRPQWFNQNFLTGCPGGAIRLPAGGMRVPFVDVRDIAAVAIRALSEPGHDGQAYVLTGPEILSHREVAAILSQATGKSFVYEDVPPEVYRKTLLEAGLSDYDIELILKLFELERSQDPGAVHDDIPRVLGRPAISFRQFAEDFAEQLAKQVA